MRAAAMAATMVATTLGLGWSAIAAADVPLVPKPDVPRLTATAYTWPLEQAPSLVAHAQVDLAPDRCAKLRDDGRVTTRYALAWCAVGQVDARDSLAALHAIGEQDTGYYGRGARADVVDLLADRLALAEQLRWLASYGSAETYDRLVATFVELGRDDDALHVAVARPPDHASVETACHRAAQVGSLRHHTGVSELQADIVAALKAIGYREPDWRACEWIVMRTNPEAALADALAAWPADRAEWTTWIHVAHRAAEGRPLDGADELAIAALTNAAIVGGCDVRAWVADEVRSFDLGVSSDARLRALLAACP